MPGGEKSSYLNISMLETDGPLALRYSSESPRVPSHLQALFADITHGGQDIVRSQRIRGGRPCKTL